MTMGAGCSSSHDQAEEPQSVPHTKVVPSHTTNNNNNTEPIPHESSQPSPTQPPTQSKASAQASSVPVSASSGSGSNEAARSAAMLDVARSLTSVLDMDGVVSRIITKSRELLDTDRCSFFFVDNARKMLRVKKAQSVGSDRTLWDWLQGKPRSKAMAFEDGKNFIEFPMNKGLAGHVATTGETLIIHDCNADARFNPAMDKKTGYHTRNMLVVPMLNHSSGEIIGVIQAINKNPANGDFDAQDQTVLSTFSLHASVAILNSQLFEQSEASRKQSQALAEITRALSKELKIGPLVTIITKKVQTILNADRCTLFIVDDDSGKRTGNERLLYTNSTFSAGMGKPLPISTDRDDIIRFPITAGLAGYVARKAQTLNIPDAYQDARFNQAMDRKTGYRTQSLLCMPVINHRNEVCGVIQVINKLHKRNLSKVLPFGDSDVENLELFSSQASVAIENCKLFQDTEKALNHALLEVRNLKFMLSVTKSMSSQNQTAQMMHKMTRQINSLVKAHHCYVYLCDREVEAVTFMKVNSSGQMTGDEQSRKSWRNGLAGFCCRTGKLVNITDQADQDKRFDASIDCAMSGHPHPVKSILCMPIMAEKIPDSEDEDSDDAEDDATPLEMECIGCIVVQDEQARGGFDERTEKLLDVFCHQASVAIVNSQRVKKILDESETRKTDTAAADNLREKHGMRLGVSDITSFQFGMADIEFQKSIGAGSYGEVWRGVIQQNGKPLTVAVKKLFAKHLKGEHVEAFCSESSLMIQLKHKNVVQFLGAVTEPPELCIICEYCSRGGLADLLLDSSVQMDDKRKVQMCLDTALGMDHLHTSNPTILHRDLKSDNLMVAGDWTIKVGDFGLTRFKDDKQRMTQVGTPMWMAPEVLLGDNYTEKADVYAFGIILWEIMTREEPYDDKETMQIVIEVVNEGLRPKISAKWLSHPLVPLMKDCWHEEPKNRPNFNVIIQRLEKIQAALQ